MTSADRRLSWCIRVAVLCLAFAIGGIPSTVAGQVLYGSITGRVTDPTGGAIPGATVAITQNETKAKRETVTDHNGAYQFPTVQSGTYTVVVTLTGFQTFTRRTYQ